MISSILILMLLCATLRGSVASELVLVQIVHRHGDRAPARMDPNDVDLWKSINLPEGQLSSIGEDQLQSLGVHLREMYIDTDYLPQRYNHKLLFARTSDVDRCYISAYSMMSTLYPDDMVPVHSVPKHEDKLLRVFDNCPSYGVTFQRSINALGETFLSEDGTMFKEMKSRTGWGDEYGNGRLPNLVADNIQCKRAHGLDVDPYLEENFDEIFRWGRRYINALLGGEENDKRGPPASNFVKQLAENMQNAIDAKSPVRMYLYSAHDSTLASLFHSLNMLEGPDDLMLKPNYATTFIIELRRDSGGYFVDFKLLELDAAITEDYIFTERELEFSGGRGYSRFKQYANKLPSFEDGCCMKTDEYYLNNCDDIQNKNSLPCKMYFVNCPGHNTSDTGTSFWFYMLLTGCFLSVFYIQMNFVLVKKNGKVVNALENRPYDYGV